MTLIAPSDAAALVLREKERIVRVWMGETLRDPSVPEANRLPETALRDHAPDLLDQVASALDEASRAPADAEHVARIHGCNGVARVHALIRAAQEYDLGSYLQELSHLRMSIMEVLRDHGTLDMTTVLVVNTAVDEAMRTGAMTARDHYVAALRKTEAKLEAFSAANVVGIVTSDLEGRILDANDRFLSLLGRGREALLAGELHWNDLTPQAHRGVDADIRAELSSSGASRPRRKECLAADGSLVPVLVTCALLPGDAREAVALVVDMREQAAIEAKLKEEARLREQFVAILGHDLRQPLNALGMGLSLLAPPPTAGAAERGIAQRMERALERMKDMIGILVDAARTLHGPGIPVVRERVELGALVEAAIAEASLAWPEARFERVGLPAVEVEADAMRFAQVLANVLSNAAAYGAARAPIRVVLGAEPSFATIVVRNRNRDGRVPEAVISRAFAPFERGTLDGGVGLGLGLFIAREIVSKHDGEITMTSDEEFTSVRIAIPLPSR
jgi:PAS domain S-box-containing protein